MHSERESRNHHCTEFNGARHSREGGNPLMLTDAVGRRIEHDTDVMSKHRFLINYVRINRTNETRK